MFVIQDDDYFQLHIFPDDKQLWNNLYTFGRLAPGLFPCWCLNPEVIDWLTEYMQDYKIQPGRRLVILFRHAEEIMAFKLRWM